MPPPGGTISTCIKGRDVNFVVLFCFCCFMCFPCFFGMFLSFCYIFLSVFSVFFDFVIFSFQFATHFGKFRVAVSQISHVSSILRLFLSILLMFFIIAVCSFQSDVCRSHFVYFVQVFRSHAWSPGCSHHHHHHHHHQQNNNSNNSNKKKEQKSPEPTQAKSQHFYIVPCHSSFFDILNSQQNQKANKSQKANRAKKPTEAKSQEKQEKHKEHRKKEKKTPSCIKPPTHCCYHWFLSEWATPKSFF